MLSKERTGVNRLTCGVLTESDGSEDDSREEADQKAGGLAREPAAVVFTDGQD